MPSPDESSEPRVYLKDLPLAQARARFRDALSAAGLWAPLDSEEIPLEDALGRVTAEPVWARSSSPHYHAAAMDGYAVRAHDTIGASDRSPIALHVGPQGQYVDTGDLLPSWADAVIPIEDVEPVGTTDRGRATESFLIRHSVSPWSHVRTMGEDMVVTELVVPAGQQLRPVDLGAIAGSGSERVRVRRRPNVAVIPTGSELIDIGSDPEPGQIIEYNSLMLASQLRIWGGRPTCYPAIPDDLDRLKQIIKEASVDHDLVLIIAGSSAGLEDFTARVVEEMGDLLVHGVAVRPGHPVILGVIRAVEQESPNARSKATAIIGVPGYPVSAVLTGEIFIEPLLARWLGRNPHEPITISARLTRKVHSSLGDDEYLRVTVGRVGDQLVVAPLARGAGVLTSLVRADGLVVIPAGVQGHEAGELVEVRLYRQPPEIERTIVALGSHDLTLDLMAQFLAERGSRLTSANVGSLGGLVALSRGEAHLAGSHLLDPESGEFNLAYVGKYLPEIPVLVIGLAFRQQGLILASGNPQGIRGLEDLAKPGVTFVNRQRGSGTRLLLDYHLGELGLDPEQIVGYDREEYTHMTVSAAIASGRIDCGLGIQAAAEALNLSFIPLFQERYDLVIPRQHHEDPKLRPLLDLLQDSDFRQAVSALPGYDIAPMGKVIGELG